MERINIEDIILQHYHGFTKEQWQELKNRFPYCEIIPIIKEIVEAVVDRGIANNKLVERFTGDTDEFGLEYSSSVRYIEELASERSIEQVKKEVDYG